MNKKVAAPVQKTEINGRGDRCADHVTPLYPQKLALTSPTGGGRSVGIVRSRTKATELCVYNFWWCLTLIGDVYAYFDVEVCSRFVIKRFFKKLLLKLKVKIY